MTDAEHKSARWVRRKDARPTEIVEAALDLFVEKGYVATKMEDIARRAGVTKGTPYLYFANKEEIFKEVVRSAIGSRLSESEELVRNFDGSSVELLRLAVTRWWAFLADPRISGIPKLMMAEAGNFPDLARFYAEEVILRSNRTLEEIIRRGIDRGEFRPVDTDYAVSVLVGPMMKALMWKHSFACCGLPDMDMDRFLDAYFDLMMHGLLAPAGRAAP